MPDNSLYDEKKLLSDIANGDETAFRAMLDKYWSMMYSNFLYHCKQSELATELTQDLFVAIWQSRERLANIERFDAYLYKSAKNLVLGTLRKKVMPFLDQEAFDPYFTDDGLSGIELLEVKELESLIHDAINELPPQMQKAFTLHRFHGLSHEQIALEMNISRLSSQTYVARAVVQLRAILARHNGEIGLLACLLLFP